MEMRMSTTIVIIEVAILFFALGVIVHSMWAMKRDEDCELDLTPFGMPEE